MKNKKRLLAVLLAAATMTCAGAFGGCNSDDDSGSGKPENGIQVDGEQWATEINKFKLDNNLSELDSYTIKADITQSYSGQTQTEKHTAYVNRKDKEFYAPDNIPTTLTENEFYTIYLKLGAQYALETEDKKFEVCTLTDISYGLKNNEAKFFANKNIYEYNSALFELDSTSLLTMFNNIKIGENVLPLNKAQQYFEFDETNGTYKGQNIGIALSYKVTNENVDGIQILHPVFDYTPCDVEIRIKESSFTAKMQFVLSQTDPQSGETIETSISYNFEICNFNSTHYTLSDEVKAELDKLNNAE